MCSRQTSSSNNSSPRRACMLSRTDLTTERTTTRAGRWGKVLVLDDNLLSTGPYTMGVNNSHIGLVSFPYPRETSSKNSSAHRIGAGCAYGSLAASIRRYGAHRETVQSVTLSRIVHYFFFIQKKTLFQWSRRSHFLQYVQYPH